MLQRLGDIEQLLGYKPFPGTLNVRLNRNPKLNPEVAPCKIGGAAFWPVKLKTGPAHFVRWPNDARTTSIELVAPTNLRSTLSLKDKSHILIEMTDDN
jgi:CTP-dependent riboflavin kinase